MAHFSQPYQGQTDANGNASIKIGPISNVQHFLGYVTAKVSGGNASVTYTLTDRNGFPWAGYTGLLAVLGAIYIAPQDWGLLVISGGPVNATIQGYISGDSARSAAELVPPPAPTSSEPVVGFSTIAGSVVIPGITQVQAQGNVGLLGAVSGAALGDSGAAALLVDSCAEAIAVAGQSFFYLVGVIASFKPAGAAQIAKVGQFGPFTTGTSTQVSPTFGQPTTAGNFLTCQATAGGGTASPTTTAAGWVKVVDGGPGGQFANIWKKENCLANEVPPVFTVPSGATCMTAQLAEWANVALANATDQTGSLATNTPGSADTIANAAVDAAPGDLILVCTRWAGSANAGPAASYSDTFSNGAATIAMGNNGNGDMSACVGSPVARYVNNTAAVVPAFKTSLPLQVQGKAGGTPIPVIGVAGGQAFPVIGVAGGQAVAIIGVAGGQPVPVAPQPIAYDVSGTSDQNITGVAASVVLAATPGKTYTAHTLLATVGTTAAAISQHVNLIDGVTKIAQFTQDAIGTAFNMAPPIQLVGLAFKGTTGSAMTWQFDGAGANNQQDVTIGAFLR